MSDQTPAVRPKAMRLIRFASLCSLLSPGRLGAVGVIAALAMFSLQQLERPDHHDNPGAAQPSYLPSYPPALGGPDNSSTTDRPAAVIRRALMESDDLFESVIALRPTSPAAAKLAASDVLMVCSSFRRGKRSGPAHDSADEALQARCAGIRNRLRRNDAVQMAIDLRISAEQESSLLGRLASLLQRRDQLSLDDRQTVSDGLRSADAVALMMAAELVYARLGSGLRDDELRRVAFERALLNHLHRIGYEPTPFDALGSCANRDCGRQPASIQAQQPSIGVRETLEIERLAALYHAALAQSRGIDDLMGIR